PIPAEARERFAREAIEAAERLARVSDPDGRRLAAEVDFSLQEPGTDTLAATPAGEPFRQDDGTLLLRPGGHGALLGNLAALAARWVLLKNVDNVRPAAAQPLVAHWQEVLGGLLVTLEERGHELVRRLRGEDESALD